MAIYATRYLKRDTDRIQVSDNPKWPLAKIYSWVKSVLYKVRMRDE